LPLHAQEIYLAAFNNAWTEYQSHGPEQREQTAHRVAWAAVKRNAAKGSYQLDAFRCHPDDRPRSACTSNF
jgi:cation transport regulator ChaB